MYLSVLIVMSTAQLLLGHLFHSPVKVQDFNNLQVRTQSLTRLLHHITTKYFEGCDIVTYYDGRSNVHEPIDFKHLYKNFPFVSFVKQNSTNSEQVKHNSRHKCYNYMIFIKNIFSIDQIMKRETRNKILVITESTPWAVKDFLKSYAARSYVNLLVALHSTSRRTKAR